MNETCENAKNFWVSWSTTSDWSCGFRAKWTDEGCLLNLSGDDVAFALAENGEMLDAFETLLFQIMAANSTASTASFAMPTVSAKHESPSFTRWPDFAADQVRKNGRPFTFGVLNSTERRIIHLTLQKEDDLDTESVGDGRDRRLQVRLK